MVFRTNLFFLAAAFILTVVFFHGVKENEFLFIHDEFLVFPGGNLNLFSVYSDGNFGFFDATSLLANFFDRIYYGVFYSFGTNIKIAEQILYCFKLFLLLALPYLGFSRILSYIGSRKEVIFPIVISFWYAFNTFSIIYWNNNAFSLTLLLCYALAPLSLYFIQRSLFEENALLSDRLASVSILFLMSFALPFFLAFLLFVVFYGVFFVFISFIYNQTSRSVSILTLLKNIGWLLLLYVPLSPAYILLFYSFTSNAQTVNSTGGETYGMLQGGLLSQMLFWFSWGIYTEWRPKSIFTFSKALSSWQYIITPFILYGLVVYVLLKEKMKNVYFLSVFSALLFFLLLSKGAQEPFGFIYLTLLDHISFFRAFRSPDSKFGFIVILALSVLLLFSLKYVQRKLIYLLFLIVISIQGWPLFSGDAIVGKTSKYSYDRIIHISEAHKELSLFLNDPGRVYGSVVSIPSIEFGLFSLDKDESFIGQDVLPKLVHLPFVQLSENGNLPVSVYKDLLTGAFARYPIRYYLVRSDIDSDMKSNMLSLESFKQIFQKKYFTLYENLNSPSLIRTESNPALTFTKVSPVEYRVSLKGVHEKEKLFFYNNYHDAWKLFPADVNKKSFRFFFDQGISSDTHTIGDGSFNVWDINPREFGYDGSNRDVDIIIYFKPQWYFEVGIMFSGFFLVVYIGLFYYCLAKKK